MACTFSISDSIHPASFPACMRLRAGSFTGFCVNRFMAPQKNHYTDETSWSIPTCNVTFTPNDVNPTIARRASFRASPLAIEQWSKLRGAVKTEALVRKAFTGNSQAAVAASDANPQWESAK